MIVYLVLYAGIGIGHGDAEDEDNTSNSDFDENYKNLDAKQLKYLVRKKLINCKLAAEVLEEVTLYDS